MAIGKLIPAFLLAGSVVVMAAQTRSDPQRRSGPPGRSSAAAQQRTAGSPGPADLKPAEDLLEKQQYAQAEEKLLAIVAMDAANPQAWFDLGFAQSHLGKTSDAIAAYRKAAQLSPKWFEAQQNLGLALADSHDLAGAAAAFRAATTLKPTTGGNQALARAWALLGWATEETSPPEALAAYQKAVELDSASVDPQRGMARLTERAGDLAAAEQQYGKLAQAGDPESIGRLVALFIRQKRYADAETWLRKYLAANPGNALVQAQLGKVLAAEGKMQDAIAMLEPAYNAAPNPDLARVLAGLYLDLKQYAPAATLLRQLTAQDANDAQLHYDYGSALLHLHQYPEAQAELVKAVQLKSGMIEAYFDLAYAAHQNKDDPLVIRVLDARARLQPETPATYFLRAEAYDSLRMYKPAAENYKFFLAAAGNKFPDQEFQARHRLKAIQPE